MKEWQKELYILRLNPAPPREDDFQEYIELYFAEKDEKYFAWFLHYYEPILNTLAMGLVQRYAMQGHFVDLKDACVFGIVRALQSYDVSSGIPFLTYKTRLMWEEIHEYIRTMRNGFTIESKTVYANLRKIMAIYNQSGGKCDDVTVSKIAKEIGRSEKRVREMLASGLRNQSFVEFYVRYADEDSERSREDVTSDYIFEPCRELLHTLQHDALFEAFDSLPYREREVIRAHLGFCESCHTTKGRKNRKQTFYEIAIDHELSSAEAAENIYQKGILRMKEKLKEKGYDEK